MTLPEALGTKPAINSQSNRVQYSTHKAGNFPGFVICIDKGKVSRYNNKREGQIITTS